MTIFLVHNFWTIKKKVIACH